MSAPPAPSSEVCAAAPESLRAGIAEVWRIAWPTVLTMASFTVMQFVDRLMVGQLGPLEVAAQGNASVWTWTPISIVSGVLMMVNTFVAQHLGAGTPREGMRYGWSAIWLGAAIWLVVLLPMAAVVPSIFEAIHGHGRIADSERLVALESSYAQILLLGGVVMLTARTVHNVLFGLHRPKVVTVSAVVANVVNVLLNFVLIFGEQGIPRLGLPGIPGTPALGLAGAAIATICGSAIELAIPAWVLLSRRTDAELGTRAAWRPCLRSVRDLLRVGWPMSLQNGNELVCWAIFMTVLVGWFGEDHMTAGWITLGYMHLAFMPGLGCSVAVTSLVGKYVGAGRPDLAASRARLGVGLAMAYMVTVMAIAVVLREDLIRLFLDESTLAPERVAAIVAIGAPMIVCAAVFQAFDAVGIVYAGALRGAGDTLWPGVVTMIYSWAFIVGGGVLLMRLFPEWESLGPWIASAVYLCALGLTMGLRFESGSWRRLRLVGAPHPERYQPVPEAERADLVPAIAAGDDPRDP